MTGKLIPQLLLVMVALTAAPSVGQSLEYGRFEGLFDEPVTMSATGKPERVSDTPVTMDVITADEIKRSGARDIPTLLKILPGVDVYNGSPGTEEVAMGGYIQSIGARILVMLNGRQIYLGSFGAVFWSSLPVELDEIRQIEVIRGPQSALYGFNAVDGVINIITLDPAEDDISVARVRGGNDARRDGSASLTQSLADGIGLRITVAGDHAHDEGGISSPLSSVPTENPDRKVLSAGLSAILPNDDRVRLEGAMSDISQRSVAAGTAQFFNARDKTDSLNLTYTADTMIGRLGASAALILSDIPEAFNGGLGDFRLHDHTAAVQLYDLFKLSPADSVRLGLEARNENMNVVNFSAGTISGRLLAGSAMWEHQFAPGLTLVDAVRYDDFHLGRKDPGMPGDLYTDQDYNRSVQGYSVNSSLIDKLDDQDTLRASLSRGLALPSLLDFGQLALFMPQYGGNYYYGNPNLHPSAVYEERLGWEHQLPALAALARLSIYHEETVSVIQTANLPFPTPPPPTCVPGNPLAVYSCIGQGYVKGASAVTNGIQFQLDHKSQEGWQWGVNYSLERLHDNNTEMASGSLQLQAVLPVNKLNANIGYGGQNWTADIRLFYASAVEGGDVVLNPLPTAVYETVKAYTTIAPHLSWTPLERLRVEFTADNLWTYRDNLAQRTPVTYYASVVVSY